jgi:hypothetical protein
MKRWIVAMVLLSILLGVGIGYAWCQQTSDSEPPDSREPVACSLSEDSQLLDCTDGSALDYRNGGWWRHGTTDDVKATWNR